MDISVMNLTSDEQRAEAASREARRRTRQWLARRLWVEALREWSLTAVLILWAWLGVIGLFTVVRWWRG
jgi:hypothetical protein